MNCRLIYLGNYIDVSRNCLNNEWVCRGDGAGIRLRGRRSVFASGSVSFQHQCHCRGRAHRPPPNAHAEAGSQRRGGAAPAKLVDRLTPNLNRTLHRHRTRESISGGSRNDYRTRPIFADDIAVSRPDTPDSRFISRLAVSCRRRALGFPRLFHSIGPLSGLMRNV